MALEDDGGVIRCISSEVLDVDAKVIFESFLVFF